MTVKRRGVHAILIAFLMIFTTAGVALGAKPADNTKGSNGNPNPGNPHETSPPSDETSPPSDGTSPNAGPGAPAPGHDGPDTSSNSGSAPGAETAGASGSTLAAALPLPLCDTTPPFGGIFELDGDAVNDSACPGDDWNSVSKTFVADKIGKAGDNTYFFQGGSKDIHDVSDWRNRTNDEAPDKDDITNAYAKPYIRDGQLIVVFGADRYSNNGSAQMGFWFFQDSIGIGADGTFDGLHRVGDILVLVDFTNGGTIGTVKAYKWVASGGDVDTHLELVASGIDCRTASVDATVCGSVNLGDADAPWPYTPKDGTAGIFPTASFFEGGINITALAPETKCISSYLAETRTSHEPSARLKDFALGDFELCPSILGSKFHDLDGDGSKDAGEPTLAGWDIHLFGTSGGAPVHLHTVTHSNGAYSFDLQPGTYTVCEGTKDGWFQSFPTNGPNCDAHAGAGGFGYTVALGLGVEAAGKNFGNFQNATVQGFKFQDKNGDAVRDVLDPALGGVRLHLFGTTSGGLPVHAHTTTDVLGTYGFLVAPGTYTLCEDIPAGWTQSFPASGPNCATHGDGAGGFGHSLTLTSGQSSSGAGFGNFTVVVLPSRITRVEGLSLAALPATGIDAMSWAFLATVMITIGSLMLVSDRRRRAFLSAV